MSVNFLPSSPISPVLDQLPIEESNPTNVTISDTTGHQTLVGGAGQNEISTLVGNDTIYSGFGGSLINTFGENTIYANGSDNVVHNNGGTDTIYASGVQLEASATGTGKDYVYGSHNGGDSIYTGGLNELHPDSPAALARGSYMVDLKDSTGVENVHTGWGTAFVYGGQGDNIMSAGGGTSEFFGGSGTNEMSGATAGGVASLTGGTGANNMYTGQGTTEMLSGQGSTTFHVGADVGHADIYGFTPDKGDVLDLTKLGFDAGALKDHVTEIDPGTTSVQIRLDNGNTVDIHGMTMATFQNDLDHGSIVGVHH